MRESILPRMYTATQDTVLGGVIQHVNSKKMVIVLGEPGEGKTVTMLDLSELRRLWRYRTVLNCLPILL